MQQPSPAKRCRKYEKGEMKVHSPRPTQTYIHCTTPEMQNQNSITAEHRRRRTKWEATLRKQQPTPTTVFKQQYKKKEEQGASLQWLQ
jgi:hypothetical protein